MWVLPLVGYLGVLLGFSFLTLAIASGLYYLSELVEEHTVLARRVLTRLIYTVIGIQVLLALIDRFPAWLSTLSIASHVIYLGNLRHFPIVKLSDPIFITSCVLVLINHFLWFRHFSTPPSRSPGRSRYDPYTDIPSFTEIASYFGICVWLVPFALFVSLSAGEMVLPSMGSEYATGDGGSGATGGVGLGSVGLSEGTGRRTGRKAKGLVKAAIDGVGGWVGETGEAMGFWRGDRMRSDRKAF